MAITTADIKLLASARMTDDADGGGAMTGSPLQDGAENNVFPDLSTLDRAKGAIQFRKVYPAVLNAGTDTLLGAYVALSDAPDDADVSAVLIPSSGGAQQLESLTAGLNSNGQYRGITTLSATLSSGAAVATVGDTFARLVPTAFTLAAVDGVLAAESTSPSAYVTAYVPVGARVAAALNGVSGSSGILSYGGPAGTPVMFVQPGSTSGTFVGSAAYAGTVVSSGVDGTVSFNESAVTTRVSDQTLAGDSTTMFGLVFSAPIDISFQPTLPASLPLQTQTLAITSANRAYVYVVSIPVGTEPGSESVEYYPGVGTPLLFRSRYGKTGLAISDPYTGYFGDGVGGGAAYPGYDSTITVNRAAGTLTLTLTVQPAVGTNLVVRYAAGGATISVPFSALSASGVLSGTGALTITPTAGYRLQSAAFKIGSTYYSIRNSAVLNAAGTLVGGYDHVTGALLIASQPGATISEWYGLGVAISQSATTFNGVIPASLVPSTVIIGGDTAADAPFTATANSGGVFSTATVTGTYDAVTGALSLTFSTPVKLGSLTYDASQATYGTTTADLQGLNAGSFPTSGKVQIIRVGDVVVVQDQQVTTAATAVVAGTVNVGRTSLASVRVLGSDDLPIATGWTANLTTGILTWVDVTGYAQPVRVQHGIEHLAVVNGITGTTSLSLNLAPTRTFPSGSTVSSALVLGDLRGSAGLSFSQQAWTDAWADSRIGTAILAQYQQLSNPIVVSNNGAINERWAIIFTTSSAFRVVGESVGQITTGDINSVLSPINPATGYPYFTLPALGWGGGWSAGNVLRFNTTGANAPVWVARTVQPSAPNSTVDSLTIAIRGDIDA